MFLELMTDLKVNWNPCVKDHNPLVAFRVNMKNCQLRVLKIKGVFTYGNDGWGNKDGNGYVRLVRSGQ